MARERGIVVPAAERKAIRQAFPLLSRIKDADLRESVIRAWFLAWKESCFETLEEAPFGNVPTDSLVKHSNASASGAYVMGKQLQQEYGVTVNLDHVIAGALLHDMDKIVTYEKRGDKVQPSARSEYMLHGAYGGHLALLAGLPMEIVFIIMAHGENVNAELKSPEGKLISYAELAKIRSLQAAVAKQPSR